MEKVIHSELCKKFKFDHTNKRYLHNRESVLENETHKFLCDREIQMDRFITARRLEFVIVKKHKKKEQKTCRIVDFTALSDHRVKLKDSEKRDKYLDPTRELKRTLEHKGDGDTNRNCCTWNDPQRIDKGTGTLRNIRTSEEHPNYRIIKNGQNTLKSPGD